MAVAVAVVATAVRVCPVILAVAISVTGLVVVDVLATVRATPVDREILQVVKDKHAEPLPKWAKVAIQFNFRFPDPH